MSAVKRSLEEAILIAKLSVENDENKVIIDRTRFASRKCARICDISISKGPLENITNIEESNKDVLFWRGKHDTLFIQTKTQEKDLSAALKRNDILENYVKLLEQKISVQQTELSKETNICHPNSLLQEKLKLYETITGVTLKMDSNEYICTMKNGMSRLVTRFGVKIRQEQDIPVDADHDNDMQFRPVGNVHLLPEYLRSEVECSSEMAPVLLGDIIRCVYEEQQQ
jgi:hypothetical protein